MKPFKQQMEETREAVSQITCWRLTVAAHQEFGIGSVRQDRLIERINHLEEINIHTMMQKGTRAADREREGWLRGFAPMEFTVPMLRAPRGRKEQQFRMAGNEAASISWQLFAAACIDVLGFGAERLEKLRAEGWKNYQQFNGWAHEDGLDVAMERLKRCAEAAIREDLKIIETDPGDWNRYEEELRASERMALRVELSSLKALRAKPPQTDAEKERIFRQAMEETLSARRA